MKSDQRPRFPQCSPSWPGKTKAQDTLGRSSMKRINRSLWSQIVAALGVAVCATLLAPAASAAPINYTINFTPTSGIAPTSGTFTYDSSLSLGSRFSSFIVVWQALTFDLTPEANAPSFSGSACGTSGSSDAFPLMSGNACSTHFGGFPNWDAVISPQQFPQDFFRFRDISLSGSDSETLFEEGPAISQSANGASATGGYSISAQGSSTPEPSSMVLLSTGGIALWLLRRRRQSADNKN